MQHPKNSDKRTYSSGSRRGTLSHNKNEFRYMETNQTVQQKKRIIPRSDTYYLKIPSRKTTFFYSEASSEAAAIVPRRPDPKAPSVTIKAQSWTVGSVRGGLGDIKI